jgi:hypothetical protein|tara:strand:- start:105 stop:1700 length:1596 start_codon:yes stop_codon:yes gene_type:complete
MRNIDLYRGGSRGLLGGQVARIPSYTAKPYDIETPASARYGFAAKMVEALTAKAQENKEKEDMAAYMAARSTKFDPSAITPLAEDSPYLSVQRENMAQALAGTPQSPLGGSADNVFEPQERSVDGMQPSSLGVSADDVFLPATGVEPFRLIDPSQGEEGAALDAGQRALSSNPAMQAALLGAVDGDVGTRAEDEAAYMAEQYANRITPRQAVQDLTPQTKAGRDAQYAYELSRIERDEALSDEQREQQFQKELKAIGPTTSTGDPSAVREHRYYEWLGTQPNGKQLQENYLATRRAAPSPYSVGGSVFVPSITPGGEREEIVKTLAPGEKPETKRLQAEAKAEGEEEVKGTIAEQKIDEEFAKEYAVGVAGGGYEDASKQVDQLESAIAELGTSEDLTGPARGMVPDFVRAFTNPKAVDIKERVEEVVQRNLRLILGAQFTEKEGERLISRAYNDRLQEDVNVARLNRLVGAMRKALAAKMSAAQYYEDNGTLRGWKGVLPKKSDFTGLDFDSSPQANLPAGVRSVQVVAD